MSAVQSLSGVKRTSPRSIVTCAYDPYATSFVLCEDEDRKRRLTLRQGLIKLASRSRVCEAAPCRGNTFAYPGSVAPRSWNWLRSQQSQVRVPARCASRFWQPGPASRTASFGVVVTLTLKDRCLLLRVTKIG